tara:strand:- start:90 stop:290 length:201 start_codon:yes stop_codon:yes gene_type:complete
VISVICEAFSCTPDIAVQQNPRMVRSVLEYRMAEQSIGQFNEDASKMSPSQVKMMKKLREHITNTG